MEYRCPHCGGLHQFHGGFSHGDFVRGFGHGFHGFSHGFGGLWLGLDLLGGGDYPGYYNDYDDH